MFYIIAKTNPAPGLFTWAVDATSILPPDQDSGSLLNKLFLSELMDLLEDWHKRQLIKDLTHQTVPRISVRICPSVDVQCSHLSNGFQCHTCCRVPLAESCCHHLFCPGLCALFCSVFSFFFLHFFLWFAKYYAWKVSIQKIWLHI